MGVFRRLAVVLMALATVCAACTTGDPAGDARAGESVVVRPVDPSFVYGSSGSAIDTLAATVVTDLQQYWSRAFPEHFPASWRDIDGGFHSVDTTDTDAEPPPCTAEVTDLAGNAYYCATVDAIAWDRAALLPVLRAHYGEPAVVVVLAHEMGHAVRHRAVRVEQPQPSGASPLLVEAVADCYAGAYVRWVVEGHSRHLWLRESDLDAALRALLRFGGDPGGTAPQESDAHGSAFDRISAFHDGYRGGPETCSTMTADNSRFLHERLSGEPERRNHSVSELLRDRVPRIAAHFAALTARHGRPWNRPEVRQAARTDCGAREHGAVTYCSRPPTIVVDRERLSEVGYEIGDQGAAALLASRFALAALSALGRESGSGQARSAAICLAGGYTASLLRAPGESRISAGDFDEAVTALLTRGADDRATGRADLTGLDALAAFRAGARGGAEACLR